MNRVLLTGVVLLICISTTTTATRRADQEPQDGCGHIFRDELLDNLIGNWKVTRKIRGQTVETGAQAEWVLGHQFLQLRMTDVKNPPAYEALVYIGYDNASERYVVHWLDVFGGRFSETLGYGARSGNSIKFVFEYPDGPFHNTFTWNSETKTWQFLMQSKDKTGKWMVFAEDNLRRSQ